MATVNDNAAPVKNNAATCSATATWLRSAVGLWGICLLVGAVTGCDAGCEVKTCDGLAAEVGSETSNGRTYQECVSCTADGRCFDEVLDESGETVFECTSEPDTSDCTDAFAAAQLEYCEIQ